MEKIFNIYIVYKIEKSVSISSYPTLENCLFGAVKLTKQVYVDLYKFLDMVEKDLIQLVMKLEET